MEFHLSISICPEKRSYIAIVAVLAMYNGKIGYKAKWFGLFYSWFYPAHLLLLGIIKLVFFS